MVARTPRETSVNLSVNLGGLAMKNPVTTASGTFAAGMEYSDFVDVSALGAVTTKGVSLNGWEGNASPRIAEVPSGMLNSIGLQNPGVAHLKSEELPWLREQGATTIVNVSGHSFDEYVQVIEALEEAPVDAYEVNISCPNVDAGGMTLGTHVPSVEKVVSLCREATSRPLIVKLTPNVTDITEIARARPRYRRTRLRCGDRALPRRAAARPCEVAQSWHDALLCRGTQDRADVQAARLQCLP